MIRRECRREQEVAQPIGPFEQFGPLRVRSVEGPQLPLGSTRNSPSYMELGGRRRASGEDERGERGVGRIPSVDLRFQPRHVPGFNPVLGRVAARTDREFGLGDEQLMFQAANETAQLFESRWKACLEEPQVGPELIQGSVRPDPGRILVYPRPMGETGRSAVPRAGVETRDVLASGRQGNWSNGELRPWTGQNEMCSTSLCLAS